MRGLRFLDVCSPAIRYSPDEESGAAAAVGFKDKGLYILQPNKWNAAVAT